jgi:hypothetical protein
MDLPWIKPLTLLLLGIVMLTLSGCGESIKTTTPVGPLGDTTDFPHHAAIADQELPDDQIQQYEAEITLDDDTDNPPARVMLRWNVFQDAPSRYLVSYSWEVLESAPGVQIEPMGYKAPLNIGTEQEVLEQATVYINWDRSSRFTLRTETIAVVIGANGQWALTQ